MHWKCPRVLLVVVALMSIRAAVALAHWPQWRGPEGNGISGATDLPTTWSLQENVAWKAPLPSWSGGTPIIWGDRVFVTSPSKSDVQSVQNQSGQGDAQQRGRDSESQATSRRRSESGRDPGGATLLLICIAKTDGAILWQRALDEGNRLWRKQNASSPSPVTDGEHVWVVTGTGAVTAFDMQGTQLWQRNLQQDYGNFGLNWGYASSPLFHKGKLIIEVLHGNSTDDASYLVAFDGLTGKEVWRRERATDAMAESPDAYTTPALLNHAGEQQIVVSGGDYVTGHDPDTGDELWRAAGLNPHQRHTNRIVGSPVVVDGMIYAPTRRTPLLALRAGGTGDVTTNQLAWKWEGRAAPDVPTPVSDGKHFYMVDDHGLVTCLDAKSGALIWGPKRTALGTVSASPVLADGNLYITNEHAVTTVVAAGPEFRILATNELDGSYTLSSMAISGRQLFLRTALCLYCIAESPEALNPGGSPLVPRGSTPATSP